MKWRLKVSVLGMCSTRIATGKLLGELFPGFLDILRQKISIALTREKNLTSIKYCMPHVPSSLHVHGHLLCLQYIKFSNFSLLSQLLQTSPKSDGMPLVMTKI